MTMTGRACLALPCDVHECPSQFVGQRSIRPSNVSPTGDDVESQNGQLVQFIFQKKDSLAVKTFSCNPAGAVPFDDESFSGKSSLGERYRAYCQRNPA
jgi:hypothetical protein